MENARQVRTGRHCTFLMHVHLVFVTKYRKVIFTKEVIERLNEIFTYVCDGFEAKLSEFNAEGDHVHLLVNYPPKVNISKLVNSLKGVSSRHLRNEYAEFFKLHYFKGVLWSPSYFAASCGGAPLDIIKQYIEKQNKPKL